MKFMTPQEKMMQLIKVCTLEFARSALRFSFHGEWMSASFFLFTAFIGFLTMVSGFSSISFSSFYLCCIYGLGFCLFFLSEIEVWNHYFFPKVNFNLMENLTNAAGEVADNIADHSGWLNMIPVCVSSYHKVRSLHVSRSSLYVYSILSPPLVACCVFTFPCVQLWRHSYGVPLWPCF